MYENNLIKILKTFSKKEMTRCREFACSPYHNKHKKVQTLMAYLEGIFPKFTQKNCEREKVFKILYPKEKHNQAQLAILFTYAVRMLEQFLIQEQFKINKGFHNILLMRHLRTKEQYKLYERIRRNQEQHLQKSLYRDSDYYNLSFLTATEEDQYYTQLSKLKKDLSIQQKQDNLDFFFISEKLRNACEMTTRSKILKVEYSIGLINAIVEEIKVNIEKYKSTPPIILYYHIYQMITQKDETYYFKAKPIYLEYDHFFPLIELRTIASYFQHFCIEQINQGKDNFLQEYFLLYQNQLDKDLLIDNDYFSEWHYKNIVTVALRLNETDWVKDFLEKYKTKLKPEVLENAYSFNLAAYYYSTKQYEKVLDLLLKVEYTDIRYNIGAKSILLRTYYALDEYEALVSLSDSFKQFIKRNKTLSDDRKKGFNNLLRFTKRAFQIKANIKILNRSKLSRELQRLIKDIEQEKMILNKSGLDELIVDLKVKIVEL